MPGKWGLHTFYQKDSRIAPMLPETKRYGKSAFQDMLSRYGSVYVKPNMAHMGKGIMKVWKEDGGYRMLRVKGKPRTFATADSVCGHVLTAVKGKAHIVQQAIPLAEVNGRSYDIRVMMMRDGLNKWRYSGMLAKVAGPSSIITNVRRGGGYVLPIGQALSRSVAKGKQDEQKKLEKELVDASYAICDRFNKYKYSSQIGIDYGVDRDGKLWLIEVNFDYPSHALFARLRDKTLYRLIKRRRRDYKNRR